MRIKQLSSILLILLLMKNNVFGDQNMDKAAKSFLDKHELAMRPLEIAANLAWWNANTTGSSSDFDKKEKAQNKIDEALANANLFQEIKSLKDNKAKITDPILSRSVDVLFLIYLEKQVPLDLLKRSSALSNKVEQSFNSFRPVIQGKDSTENDVRGILKNSLDSNLRQEAWEAGKKVGIILENDLKELVATRNQIARHLKFSNYHEMQLFLNEQKASDLIKIFDQLDDLTREPFQQIKDEIDSKLALNYKIKKDQLQAWHYHDPFFQEAPAIFGLDLDGPFKKADLLGLSQKFYKGIGLPIDRVIANSDLYEKKGKSPHAFCTDIDRSGDVRVLANVKPDDYWASTLLHEFGHAVYSSNNNNIPSSLPYLLRSECHILTTEGVAMMFERLTKRSSFLKAMGLKVEDSEGFDAAASKNLKNRLLIFSRWCQVMLRFEKGMYEDPKQDLNLLWWTLVKKYQGISMPVNRNSADYASKIHIVSAPVYYHNYMLGELFASQVHHAITKDLYPGKSPSEVIYEGNLKVGEFMRNKIFSSGKSLPWDELVKFATNKPLSAEAFSLDFKK
jgi:peptidyl-dipeptidase A